MGGGGVAMAICDQGFGKLWLRPGRAEENFDILPPPALIEIAFPAGIVPTNGKFPNYHFIKPNFRRLRRAFAFVNCNLRCTKNLYNEAPAQRNQRRAMIFCLGISFIAASVGNNATWSSTHPKYLQFPCIIRVCKRARYKALLEPQKVTGSLWVVLSVWKSLDKVYP